MLEQLTDNVYWTRPQQDTARPVLGYVAGADAALMVDAGNSPAQAKWFLGLLREQGLKQPDYVVLTHWHWDHVFGAGSINGALLAHKMTTDKLQEMSGFDWRDKALDQRVDDGAETEYFRDSIKNEMTNIERSRLQLRQPEISFDESMAVSLGEVTCRIENIWGAESLEGTIVHVIPDNVIFLAALAFANHKCEPPAYKPELVAAMLDRLLEMDADWYVSSNAEKPLDRKAFAQLEHDLRIIVNNVEKHAGSRQDVLTALRRFKSIQMDKADQEWFVDALVRGYAA